MLVATFAADGDDFSAEDWQHALGGMHVIVDVDGRVVAHGSVVQRALQIGGVSLRTGYVEAVATAAAHQRGGLGTRIMTNIGAYIAEHFELGALGTGRHQFYEQFGWRTWLGPSYVRTENGEVRTQDEDGSIMVLTTPAAPLIDFALSISCEWRIGDVW